MIPEVTGPLNHQIEVEWGIRPNGKTAVIEMAKVCGLSLIPREKRNPLVTTTYGLGEVIKCALDQGIRQFIIGLGGVQRSMGERG